MKSFMRFSLVSGIFQVYTKGEAIGIRNIGEAKRVSLWDKWEREKLEAQGIKVERPRDVEIHATREKINWSKQAIYVFAALAGCLFAVYAALTLEALFNGRRWSDTYIVHLFAEKEAQRGTATNNR
jgi:hypothetical protein